jgi:hypothetical protein
MSQWGNSEEPRSTAEEVDGGVVHEVPDEDANPAVLALINLGGLDNLLLKVNWWIPAALQKEIIETSKIDECKDRWIGILGWHFVHHTPIHLWGNGAFYK